MVAPPRAGGGTVRSFQKGWFGKRGEPDGGRLSCVTPASRVLRRRGTN